MVFDSSEWRMVAQHWPLRVPEIAALARSVQESACVGAAIILWAEAIRVRYDSR